MSKPPSVRKLGYDDFSHPCTIEEVETLVRDARRDGEQIRVRGALHAERGSVLADGFSRNGAPRRVRQVMLDKLTAVRLLPDLHEKTRRVIAEAGVSLGGDPLVPGKDNPQRNQARSLFAILDRAGLALPITGGISHQTLGGFLSTGSAGGSTTYSFQDAVMGLTLVDGTGTRRHYNRGDPDFPAVLVSLGLLGILVKVELECSKISYDIVGLRSTQAVCDSDVDLFGPAGAPNSLTSFLRKKQYSRVVWWPQPGVERLELWEAKRVAPDTLDPRPPRQADGVISLALQLFARALLAVVIESLLPKAGQGAGRVARGVDWVFQKITLPFRLAYRLLDAFLDAIAEDSETHIPCSLVWDAFKSLFAEKELQWHPHAAKEKSNKPRCKPDNRTRNPTEWCLAWLLKLFVETFPYADTPWLDDQGAKRRYLAQRFADRWHIGLPMDNAIHDRGLPVTFTEVWIPMPYAEHAMRALRDRFRRDGFAATGTFCIELYAAKESIAWISPAYDADVFRIDPFWFDDGDDIARHEFFTQFWETLAPYNARMHWGKALSPPGSSSGVIHRHLTLPKLGAFITLRAQLDPNEVFLTEYWKRHLGIP